MLTFNHLPTFLSAVLVTLVTGGGLGLERGFLICPIPGGTNGKTLGLFKRSQLQLGLRVQEEVFINQWISVSPWYFLSPRIPTQSGVSLRIHSASPGHMVFSGFQTVAMPAQGLLKKLTFSKAAYSVRCRNELMSGAGGA